MRVDNKLSNMDSLIDENEDIDILYEEVTVDQDSDVETNDLREAYSAFLNSNTNPRSPTKMTQIRPSVVDDFVRNFLLKTGMKRTLDCFNTEWYEFQSKGNLPNELPVVPDIYIHNAELEEKSCLLNIEVENMRQLSGRAQNTWETFKKERDFHRMNHRRVVQEKNKLIGDIKQLRNHMRAYEPALEEMKKRHDRAMSEKALIKIERDRLRETVKQLQIQLDNQTIEPQSSPTRGSPSPSGKTRVKTAPRAFRNKVSVFPADDPASNPYKNVDFVTPSFEAYSMKKTVQAHTNSVSACTFHPKKDIFATASDDGTWRLFTAPDCEVVMSGEGHSDWLAGITFHTSGSSLATCSADSTVKIWDLSTASCVSTLTEHTQTVWGVDFHQGGDFLASCSMDHTIRVWDMRQGTTLQTFREHRGSVNAVAWLPFSANLLSASGDKTVSMWDCRSGQCALTFTGHRNSCTDVKVTKKGDVVVSSDCDGVVKIWDIRMVSELGSINTALGGTQSSRGVNKITIDRGGKRVLSACEDGKIKIYDLFDFSNVGELTPTVGGSNALQCVAVNVNNGLIVSGGSDCKVTMWGV